MKFKLTSKLLPLYSIELNLLPIKIKGVFDVEKAKKIGILINNNERKMEVIYYVLKKNSLTVFIEGNVGNVLDDLLVKLSGVKHSKKDIFFTTLLKAKKIAFVLKDEEAHKLIIEQKNINRFTELKDNLSSIYS